MRYRSALNRCWGALSLLWIAWCLYWPFYARRQDKHEIEAQTAETYNICLQQKGMTPATCEIDRQAYTKLEKQIAWPSEQNVYQTFAGKSLSQALSFFTLLCLFPAVFGYVLLRMVVEIILRFAGLKPQDLPASR